MAWFPDDSHGLLREGKAGGECGERSQVKSSGGSGGERLLDRHTLDTVLQTVAGRPAAPHYLDRLMAISNSPDSTSQVHPGHYDWGYLGVLLLT